jgi:hypothetical protein
MPKYHASDSGHLTCWYGAGLVTRDRFLVLGRTVDSIQAIRYRHDDQVQYCTRHLPIPLGRMRPLIDAG